MSGGIDRMWEQEFATWEGRPTIVLPSLPSSKDYHFSWRDPDRGVYCRYQEDVGRGTTDVRRSVTRFSLHFSSYFVNNTAQPTVFMSWSPHLWSHKTIDFSLSGRLDGPRMCGMADRIEREAENMATASTSAVHHSDLELSQRIIRGSVLYTKCLDSSRSIRFDMADCEI